MKKEVDSKELNQVLHLSSRILKILYFVIIIGIVFIGTMLLKEWKIFSFLWRIVLIISPVILGLGIAWILNPIVTYLSERGMRRLWATSLVYIILILLLIVFFWALIPVLSEQLNELTKMIPKIVNDGSIQLNNLFDRISNIEGLEIEEVRAGVFASIQDYSKTFMNDVPSTFVSIATKLFSYLGQFAIALLVGFYLLLNFKGASRHLFSFVPNKYQKESKLLFKVLDFKLHSFVKGTLFSSSVLMTMNIIGFLLVGLKAPILFGIFCGITNIIPYIGPYIGAVPAIVVGFSQGTTTGILVLVVITITQMLEGNILHPLIMSKSMKLHPVTIIIGLLIFGSIFGIVGMIIATPCISLLKILGKFILMKLKLFDMEDYDLASEIE